MDESNKKELSEILFSVGTGFAVGFVTGALLVAIIDYYDAKKERHERIRRDSDENYISSGDWEVV